MMYYEARVHEIISAKDAHDAAVKIKDGTIQSYQVVSWVSKDLQYQFYAVPDGHIDNPMLELAILRQKTGQADTAYQQVESITNGWIKTATELTRYLTEAETSAWIMNHHTQLIIGAPNGNEKANFTCGCCGTWFEGNVKDQRKFDQDAGYGICYICQHDY